MAPCFPAGLRRTYAPLVPALIALSLGACATSPGQTSAQEGGAALVPPATASRPRLETRTLDNGLKVYLLPDDSAPLVCVQVWVKAGSVDEHEARPGATHGITGLSHFFEHLMFQGTERYPDYDRALSPLGGRNNAFTYHDATAYWSYAPREHLPLLLDLEADRFRHMKVDFVHLEPEREVVKNERRLRVDADPAEVAEEAAVALTFDRFPYRWGPIGWMSDLDAITLEEAQAYHTRHYQPDNLWLVVSGSIDMDRIDEALAATWAKVPARSAPSDASALPEPESWSGERVAFMSAEAPTTTVFLSWRAPAATTKDFAALELIDWALTAGRSGRVTQRLVLSSEPTATRVSASLMPLRHPYAWLWRVDLVEGASAREAVSVIDDALAEIARDGLEPNEMTRAVSSLRADMVASNLSHKDRAESVGFGLASSGRPFFLFERLDALAAVTNDEIRRVAAELLVPTRRVRMTLVPWERHRAALRALEAAEPHASALHAQRDAAFELALAGHALLKEASGIAEETRAIALLSERADKALKDADAEARAGILAYLDGSESGTLKRRARLEARKDRYAADLDAHRKATSAARAALDATVRRSRARLGDTATAAAIRALLGDAARTDAPRTTPGARAALSLVRALAAELEGDSDRASSLRAVGAELLGHPDIDFPPELAAGLVDLIHDTRDTRRDTPPRSTPQPEATR